MTNEEAIFELLHLFWEGNPVYDRDLRVVHNVCALVGLYDNTVYPIIKKEKRLYMCDPIEVFAYCNTISSQPSEFINKEIFGFDCSSVIEQYNHSYKPLIDHDKQICWLSHRNGGTCYSEDCHIFDGMLRTSGLLNTKATRWTQ